MFNVLKHFEEWSSKKWNEDIIRLGRDWLSAVRTSIKNYKSTKDDKYLEAASRYLSYADAYLKMLKEK